MAEKPRTSSGKWLVIVLLLVGLLLAALRWTLVPKTNPREADPGNPFYSPSSAAPVRPEPPGR